MLFLQCHNGPKPEGWPTTRMVGAKARPVFWTQFPSVRIYPRHDRSQSSRPGSRPHGCGGHRVFYQVRDSVAPAGRSGVGDSGTDLGSRKLAPLAEESFTATYDHS